VLTDLFLFRLVLSCTKKTRAAVTTALKEEEPEKMKIHSFPLYTKELHCPLDGVLWKISRQENNSIRLETNATLFYCP